jgi:hypothetical protein
MITAATQAPAAADSARFMAGRKSSGPPCATPPGPLILLSALLRQTPAEMFMLEQIVSFRYLSHEQRKLLAGPVVA